MARGPTKSVPSPRPLFAPFPRPWHLLLFPVRALSLRVIAAPAAFLIAFLVAAVVVVVLVLLVMMVVVLVSGW